MSKNKGSSGERELAKKLESIFGGKFIRVMTSGAFVGGNNASRKEGMGKTQLAATKADIIPPDFMPRLVLECKWYSAMRWHQLIGPGGCPQLDAWIKQSLDVVDEDDLWFVVWKINLLGWWIAVPEEGANRYDWQGSHAHYTGEHGAFRITEAIGFLERNRDVILKLSA